MYCLLRLKPFLEASPLEKKGSKEKMEGEVLCLCNLCLSQYHLSFIYLQHTTMCDTDNSGGGGDHKLTFVPCIGASEVQLCDWFEVLVPESD